MNDANASFWLQALAVAGGSAVGALLRWLTGMWLNNPSSGSVIPLGTLLVNCAGGLMIGMALMVLTRYPHEMARLLLITGFLGGLTTFSAFSGESLAMLQRGDWAWAMAHTLAHVLGSLACAALGYRTAQALLA